MLARLVDCEYCFSFAKLDEVKVRRKYKVWLILHTSKVPDVL